MSKFVQFKTRSGKFVYVNPDHVTTFAENKPEGRVCVVLRFSNGRVVDIENPIDEVRFKLGSE